MIVLRIKDGQFEYQEILIPGKLHSFYYIPEFLPPDSFPVMIPVINFPAGFIPAGVIRKMDREIKNTMQGWSPCIVGCFF